MSDLFSFLPCAEGMWRLIQRGWKEKDTLGWSVPDLVKDFECLHGQWLVLLEMGHVSEQGGVQLCHFPLPRRLCTTVHLLTAADKGDDKDKTVPGKMS